MPTGFSPEKGSQGLKTTFPRKKTLLFSHTLYREGLLTRPPGFVYFFPLVKHIKYVNKRFPKAVSIRSFQVAAVTLRAQLPGEVIP